MQRELSADGVSRTHGLGSFAVIETLSPRLRQRPVSKAQLT
jgi:hypothetical protein